MPRIHKQMDSVCQWMRGNTEFVQKNLRVTCAQEAAKHIGFPITENNIRTAEEITGITTFYSAARKAGSENKKSSQAFLARLLLDFAASFEATDFEPPIKPEDLSRLKELAKD